MSRLRVNSDVTPLSFLVQSTLFESDSSKSTPSSPSAISFAAEEEMIFNSSSQNNKYRRTTKRFSEAELSVTRRRKSSDESDKETRSSSLLPPKSADDDSEGSVSPVYRRLSSSLRREEFLSVRRKSMDEIEKLPTKHHHKHKKKEVSSSLLAKAVLTVTTAFDYFDTKTNTYEKMLKILMDITGSEFGCFGKMEENSNVGSRESYTNYKEENSLGNLKIQSILTTIEDIHVVPPYFEIIAKELEIEMAKPNTLYGSAVAAKSIFTFNESSSKMPGFSPESAIPLLSNFTSIPLFKSEKDPNEKNILGFVGLGNRKEGPYSIEFLTSLQPLIRTCQVLVEAHNSFKIVYDQAEIQILTTKFKDPVNGVPVKDRRQFMRTYRQCFSGKDAVNWLVSNGGKSVIRSREEALRIGNKLAAVGVFYHIIGGSDSDLHDDVSSLYSFTESDLGTSNSEENLSTSSSSLASSGDTDNISLTPSRRKSRSLLSHFSEGSLSITSDKKYQLHTIVDRKDYHTLKKKLTKKKVIEQLNSLNDNQKTALHIAIENNDFTAVELLMQSYIGNLNKANIHIKDKNGYTPLHSAAESGNAKILMSLLQYPGIQTNLPNNTKNTPFHCFCSRFPSPSSMKQIFEMFLARGTLINASNRSGETPLHKAVLNPSVRLLMVRLLLDHSPDVNMSNEKGETPLHYAIHLKRKDLVAALLSYGSDPNFKSKGTKSAYEVALEEGDQEIVTLLYKTIELNDWLSIIDMKQYLRLFIKELIFKDVLPSINEKTLIDLGITWAGDRLRILQAINKLKIELEKQAEDKKNKGMIGRVRLGDTKRSRLPSYEKVRIPSPRSLTSVSSIETQMRREIQGEVTWISYADLEFTELLGSGTSGDVYRGYYKGEEVAIKVLEKEREHRLEEFKFEFKILSSIRGNNVVHFFGACLEPKPCLVMEFCSCGSLYDLLNDTKLEFKWTDVLRFAHEMTQAIDILHNNIPQILHRDLKSMNFLVTKDWILKVSDFGLSRFNTVTNMSTLYELRGTMSYCAPETFQGKHYTTKGDIYSLGILFWEMMYRCVTCEYQRPYAEYSYLTQPLQIIVQTAQRGLRPTFPNADYAPFKSFVDLINCCWDPIPANRPDTKEILERLNKCILDLEANPGIWNAGVLAQQPSSPRLLTPTESPQDK